MKNPTIAQLNDPLGREAHRRDYSYMEWAAHQPKGPPAYAIGDVVEFHVGGIGVVSEVSQPHDGHPSSYVTTPIDGFPYRRDMKRAWHYEGDFKRLVAASPLHTLRP